jgi:N12 class adenine-specific DNA methylase
MQQWCLAWRSLINIEKVDNVRDAYILSLSDRGKLDIDYIANKAGKNSEEVVKELLKENMIFENPAMYLTHGEDVEPEYVAREQYLSGNVRLKYKQAKKAAENNARFNGNVDELRKIQPMERTQEQIYLNPENPVVPEKYLEDFVKEVILNDTEDRNLFIEHDRIGSKFTVNYTTYNDFNVKGGIVTADGRKIPQTEVFEYALNNSKPSITYKSGDDKVPDTVAINKISEMGSAFKEKFRDWVWNNKERAENIIDLYNDMYNNKHNRKYIHPLRIADPEAAVHFVGCSYVPRKHQSDVVWRIIQSQTCMMAHEVGAGKTFACIAAAMELKRLGLRKKNMIVVPNNMTGNWEKEIRAAYPGANILVSSDKNFSELKRKEFINNAAMNDYDIIVMRYSHFLAIAPNETMAATYIGKRIDVLKEMLSNIDEADQRAATRREKDIQKQIDRLESRLKKIIDGIKKDEGIPTFDLMGVDQLFVDEADNFKNLNYQSKIQNILGMGDKEGSNQAIDMHIKTQYVLGKNGGVVFATGTPISNSLVETYHMTSYLQPWYLEDNGLEAFDEWTNAMAEGKTSFEQNASGTGIVKRTRLTKYTNVQTLIAELSEVWDVVDARYLEEQGILVKGKQLPNVKRTIVEVKASEMLQDYMMHLMTRENAIRERKGPPKKGEDIIPVVMLHGAIAAIDLQIINKKIPKKGYSKLDSVIDNAIERRKKFPDKTGVIFYDKTAPKKGKESVGIDPYQVIKERLIASGTTKPEEIAIIHDYKKDELIEKVFDPFNRGEIKVLLGNTERMGAGVNIQEKLKWLFHVDTRHRPRDILQREGRIVRQGNTNDEVEIVTFVTKGTADAGMWELVNTKAKMIGNILNGRDKDTHVFDEEDQFDNVSVAALLSPSLKDRAEINQQIKAITDKKSFLISKKRTADNELPFLKKEIIRFENAIIPEIQENYESIPENKEDIVVDFGDKKIKGVKEAREEILTRFKKFEDTAVVGEKAKLFKFGNITVFTEKRLEKRDINTHDAAEVLIITEWIAKNAKQPYQEGEYTAEGIYNSIGKIKKVISNGLESYKKLLSEKKRLEETYIKDSNIDTESLNNQMKALNERLKEVEKQVEIETSEKEAAYKARISAPGYESYDWASFEAERKPTVSDDEDTDTEPKTEETLLTGTTIKDGDTYELAEPGNVYRNQSNGFKLIDKTYKVDLDIKGEYFAYKDGKEWIVIEGTTGQSFGARGKTKGEAINAALDIIERTGENTFIEAIKSGLKKRGLSPRYRVVENSGKKQPMVSAPLELPKFKLTDLAKPITPEPVKVDPVKSVKSAPSGKKMEYAKASQKLGNQITSKQNKADKDTGFLTRAEDFYKKWVDLSFPISKVEDIYDKDMGVSRETIREIDVAIDRVRGSGGIAKQFIDDNLKPIFDAITEKKGEVSAELSKYLVAKRTVWLYENKKNYIDLGIDKDSAQSFVEFVETGAHQYSKIIQESAGKIWEYGKKLLQVKKDHGIVDDALLGNLQEPYYVPFYRNIQDEKIARSVPRGERFTTISKGIKRIKGSLSGKQIIDPVQNLMEHTYETMVNAHRADVANMLITMAEESEAVGEMFHKVDPKWVRVGTIEHRGEIDLVLRPQIEELAKELGVTTEYKTKLATRIGGRLKKVLGQYREGSAIDLLVGATEGTYAHELGHAIHDRNEWYDNLVEKYDKELNAVADSRHEGTEAPQSYVTYCRSKPEKAAEFISMYITDRKALKKHVPEMLVEFEKKIAKDPTLKKLVGMKPSNIKGINSVEEDNFVQDWHIPQDADVISVLRDGKIVSYRVPIEVADAVKNLHPVMFPMWFKVLMTPNRILRKAAVTWNVDFMFPNSFRDQQESAINARSIPAYDWFIGLKEYAFNGDWFKRYHRAGGSMESAEAGVRGFSKSAEDLKYGSAYGKYLDQYYWQETGALRGSAAIAWEVMKFPFKAIEILGEASEMASRVGTFRRAQVGVPKWLEWYTGKKKTEEQAMHIARQATLDFQRFGSYGRSLNEIVPFINAAIQGTDKMVRTFKDDYKRAILMSLIYSFTPMIGLWLWNEDKEGYAAIPLQEKLNNFIIMHPDGINYFKIPKGHITKFVVNPFQIALEKINKKVTKSGGQAALQMMDDISPVDVSSMPIALRLIIEPMANYDLYWKQNIEKFWMKSLNPGDRVNTRTSYLIKKIGKALNISPIMMQHEIEVLGAGTAKNALWAVDNILVMAGIAQGDIDPKPLGVEKTPVTRRFYGKITEYGDDIDQSVKEIDKQLSKENSKKHSQINQKRITLLYEKRHELMRAKEAIREILATEE